MGNSVCQSKSNKRKDNRNTCSQSIYTINPSTTHIIKDKPNSSINRIEFIIIEHQPPKVKLGEYIEHEVKDKS